jgi:hypothetical protein
MTRYCYGADTFSTMHEGSAVVVVKGAIWDADDPFVLAHPDYFVPEPNAEHVNRTVSQEIIEAATANPGEHRNVKRG